MVEGFVKPLQQTSLKESRDSAWRGNLQLCVSDAQQSVSKLKKLVISFRAARFHGARCILRHILCSWESIRTLMFLSRGSDPTAGSKPSLANPTSAKRLWPKLEC